MSKKIPIFEYNEETGEAIAKILTPEGRWLTAKAKFNPEDTNPKKEWTGLTIADMRLGITANKDTLRVLKSQMQILKQLQSEIQQSKKYNPKSYEARKITLKIKKLNDEIEYCKECINIQQQELNNYLTDLDKFYQLFKKDKSK